MKVGNSPQTEATLLTGYSCQHCIDPVLSIVVSIIVVMHIIKALVEILNIFLIKTPSQVNPDIIRQSLVIVPGIYDVHSIRVWSIDGENHFATMHVVATHHGKAIKRIIRETLKKHHIYNSTIEFEDINESCTNTDIIIKNNCNCGHKH